MRIISNLGEFPDELRGGAVTIGNFDGVHLGHARIMERLLARATVLGGPAVGFTFDPHPARLLRPEQAPPPLTWLERKAELLGRLGVEALIAYPTDEEFLRLGPRPFFEHVVGEILGARAIVEGPNFFFGHRRAGTIGVLRRLCVTAGVNLDVVEPVQVDGSFVSSSRIRQTLAEGRVDEARAMLTQPYRIRGLVVHGAQRGRKLGFPTANVDAIDTLLPGPGIYAGRALAQGKWWPAALSIGPNPTFDEHALKVEAYLLDFDARIYGDPIEIDFLARLRDVETFESVDQLVAQLHRDVADTRRIVDTMPTG